MKHVLPAVFGTLAIAALMINREPIPGGLHLGLLALGVSIFGVLRSLRLPKPVDTLPSTPVSKDAFLLAALVALLYLPQLGSYGLWDPWESHYAEVAREMLAREDWISLWWAHDHWFWSKPVLLFWLEALSLKIFGVAHSPGQYPHYAEWALRLPAFLMATSSIIAVFALAKRFYTRRAGWLAALILATAPQFFFIAHQAITDIPFVSIITIATTLLIFAIHEDPDRKIITFSIGPLRFSLQHLLIAALIAIVLPQALYLISRNIVFEEGILAFRRDRFLFGSGLNPDVPGNPAHRMESTFFLHPMWQPAVQGGLWIVLLAWLIFRLRKEQHTQALTMFGFYLCCGLAFLAKGIPGFALPGLVALFYLVASGRWNELTEGRFHIARGALTVCVVGLPWYVAMFTRHGPDFTDRLFIHDHINRLAAGVHGDKASIEYFIQQLGYGMFPWSALLPFTLVLLVSSPVSKKLTLLVALWFFTTFTLFSAMMTKFHHYILPALPPAALLVAALLDRALGKATLFSKSRWHALYVIAPVPLLLGVGGWAGNLRGKIPESAEQTGASDWVVNHGLGTPLALFLIALGLATLAAAWLKSTPEEPGSNTGESQPPWSTFVVFVGAACLLAFIGRDLSWVTSARPQGYERFIHLFVYKYSRIWPSHLDYRPVFTAFACICCVLLGLAAIRTFRRGAILALSSTAVLCTAWSLHVYLIDLAPHWSQKQLVARYYHHRKNESEPLLAWQMNWKGENYYTGNRVYTFRKTDNKAIRKWTTKNPGKKGFVILERSRLGRLKSLLRSARIDELSSNRDNNKFVLVSFQIP